MATTYLGPNFTANGIEIVVLRHASMQRRFLFACFRYVMRAKDSTNTQTVWIADCPDAAGTQSANANKPFTDPVILDILAPTG